MQQELGISVITKKTLSWMGLVFVLVGFYLYLQLHSDFNPHVQFMQDYASERVETDSMDPIVKEQAYLFSL